MCKDFDRHASLHLALHSAMAVENNCSPSEAFNNICVCAGRTLKAPGVQCTAMGWIVFSSAGCWSTLPARAVGCPTAVNKTSPLPISSPLPYPSPSCCFLRISHRPLHSWCGVLTCCCWRVSPVESSFGT